MKYPLKILVFFLLIILIIPRLSYSRNDTLDTGKAKFYKNSIKAKPTFIPLVGVVIFAGLSLGYEHYFSQRHGLELCSYYNVNIDEMGADYRTFSIMPGFKFFSVSENHRKNNWWISPYLSYYQKIQMTSDQGQSKEKRYAYGIGVSGGKKMNLSRNQRWFLDLGFGFSINAYLDESIFSETKWEDKFVNVALLPRLILQFGWKF